MFEVRCKFPECTFKHQFATLEMASEWGQAHYKFSGHASENIEVERVE